ncbi:MAG: N-acetyltransferase [Treponema sp.]|nr:N-acetyltransferase [Treponema sp.]
MEIELRLEEERDYWEVENLTREAFWNMYFPGADEHYLVHNLRKASEFVKALDFVACLPACGQIVGNIMYAESRIINSGNGHSSQEHTVLTFGPVSVLPEYQNKGIGAKLINHTISIAKKMGYKAILIYGAPEYYRRFGFAASKNFNITNKDGKFPAALLVLELFPNALDGIHGVFDEGQAYQINADDAAEFDKKFPAKEKFKTESQERFLEIAGKFL